MASKKQSPERLERIAEILVEAFLAGDDRKVSERHGITDRTLRNWRKRLDTNVQLSEIFRTKKAKASDGWADEVPGAIRASVTFLRKAAEEGNHKDPNMVHSVAGAMKLLSETAATWKLLDVRLARTQQAAANDTQPQPPASLPN